MANDTETNLINHDNRQFAAEVVFALLVVVSGSILAWQIWDPGRSMAILCISGLAFTVFLVMFLRLLTNLDSVRARQSDVMLKLSRQAFAALNGGLNKKSAEKVCTLLMPTTAAVGIVITNNEDVLGLAGFYTVEDKSILRHEVCEEAAKQTLADGTTRILTSPRDIDLSVSPAVARAIIVVPVTVGRRMMGTLQFYFKHQRDITETQLSIAEGFGALIGTQLAANALEEQTKLATDMRLKALQNQINPHFLFNTINTIASLIRTNPMKARSLLREFAVFYRQTLENGNDLILLSREAEQTYRYFTFEVARFGEERVELVLDEEEGVEDMLVPSFLIQPLVENAVRHAMPAEGKLTVTIQAYVEDDNLIIKVIDNGVGMTPEACATIMHPESSTGMGIAVKNVHDRIKGYFGPESKMIVESELGEGTTVTLVLVRKPEEEER